MKLVVVVGADAGVAACPPQGPAYKSKARFVCLVAGTRGGKTRTAARKFFARILRDHIEGRGQPSVGQGKDRRPHLHYWVVAPTTDLLKEPKRYLSETIPQAFLETPGRPISHENQMWLKNDILIEFRSADHPLSLVSVGLNGMWLDEAARIKSEAWVGNLRGRLSDKMGWALFSSTPLGQNWLYVEVFQRGEKTSARYEPEYESFQWHTSENLTISRTEIESVKRTLPARYFKREYEADFSAFLGNVYDEFDEKLHVITEAQLRYDYGWGMKPLKGLFRTVVAGVDWGWSSPGAIVVVGDTGRELIALEESYADHRSVFDPRMEDKTWIGEAKRLRDKWGVIRFFCDHDPGNIHDFTRTGIPTAHAFKEVTYGIRRVSEQLHPVDGKPKMRIMNTCTNLIREKRAYVWDGVRGSESYAEMPAPNQSDHALDAERYAVLELVKYEPEEKIPDARRAAGRPLG